MSVNFSNGVGSVKYSPQRDVAYLLPSVLKKVAALFDKAFWPEVVAFVARAQSVPEADAWDQLCDASQAFSKFTVLCAGDVDSPDRTIKDCFEQSGWSAIPPAAQMGYLAMFGQVMTGQLYHGLRDTTVLGGGVSDLVKFYEQTANDTNTARRILNGLDITSDHKQALTQVIRALRDNDVSWEAIDRIVTREKSLESVG